MTKPQYTCKECGNVCTKEKMDADAFSYEDDGYEEEAWSNWICPKCHNWPISLEDGWILVTAETRSQGPGEDGQVSAPPDGTK